MRPPSYFPIIAALAIICSCEQVLDPADPISCNNFYEYVCSKNIPRIPARIRDVRWIETSDDVDQYQEYVFHAPQKQRLWKVIDPDVISKWLVQFNTYWNGVKWDEHQKKHEDFLPLNASMKQNILENYFANYSFPILTRFYKSLKQSVDHLTELKIPVSTHNHFYHGIFDEIREIHISEIRRNSKYNEEQRNVLMERVRNITVLFPYLEYNDVNVWREAKSAYEREYYRLKTIISENQIPEETVEKILRVAAVNPSIEVFNRYITKFTSRFIFQHVTAAASMLSFNYQNEIHISVFTMFNPIADPKAVYNQFLYVLCHELQHVHYNIDPAPFDEEKWNSEKQCVVDRLDYFANAYKVNRTDWTGEPFSYEDSANVGGLRLMLLFIAQRTSDNNQIRDTLERSVGRFCTKNRENKHHNPHDVSINVAVSQMPTFISLYNCTPGDRMYVAPENLCKTLNMDIDVNDYTTQKIEKDDLLVLTQFMDVLENTADELDAANITTFEGELFDITVEDVEEEEEALEGSAESSESSESSEEEDSSDENELDEVSKDLDDSDKETQKAEIVSSSRFLSSWTTVTAGISFLFVIL